MNNRSLCLLFFTSDGLLFSFGGDLGNAELNHRWCCYGRAATFSCSFATSLCHSLGLWYRWFHLDTLWSVFSERKGMVFIGLFLYLHKLFPVQETVLSCVTALVRFIKPWKIGSQWVFGWTRWLAFALVEGDASLIWQVLLAIEWSPLELEVDSCDTLTQMLILQVAWLRMKIAILGRPLNGQWWYLLEDGVATVLRRLLGCQACGLNKLLNFSASLWGHFGHHHLICSCFLSDKKLLIDY